MHLREQFARLLIGTISQVALLTTGIGILLGISAWFVYPLLGVDYWLWPSSLIDWSFVIGFGLLATAVAFTRSGLLATWWTSFPAHIALAHHYYSQHGFIVLPFHNDLLSYVAIAAIISLGYGLGGYLLGMWGWWVIVRSPSTKTEIVDN